MLPDLKKVLRLPIRIKRFENIKPLSSLVMMSRIPPVPGVRESRKNVNVVNEEGLIQIRFE